MRVGKMALLLSSLMGAVVPATLAADVSWSQDLHQQEQIAALFSKPVIVIFMGNGKFDGTIFNREPVDQLGDKAQYAWVGPNLKDQIAPDQIALEKQYDVVKFPTIMILRALKSDGGASGNGDYTFRETARCLVVLPGQCAKLITMAVRAGQ